MRYLENTFNDHSGNVSRISAYVYENPYCLSVGSVFVKKIKFMFIRVLCYFCSKYGFYLIMSEGIIDLHHIIGLLV